MRLALLLVALAAAAVACTGSGDDDDVASPSPTPPLAADGCEIVWVTNTTPGPNGLVDLWLVDVPIGSWTVGTHLYGGITATWYEDYDLDDLDGETYGRRAIATSGDFALSAVSTTGAFVRFVDSEPQMIWTLSTAGALVASQGTSGTGLFEGLLSDPFAPNVTPGVGTITLVIEGTSRSLGQDLSYSVCYEDAALTRPERLRETLRRIR